MSGVQNLAFDQNEEENKVRAKSFDAVKDSTNKTIKFLFRGIHNKTNSNSSQVAVIKK